MASSSSSNPISHSLLPIAVLFRIATGQYSFGLVGYDGITDFTIPSSEDILKTCRKNSRKPPTVFLIFRGPVQKSLQNLHFRYERNEVSKISSTLWKWVKANDNCLKELFTDLYNKTSVEWRKRRLIIEFFTPLSDSSNSNDEKRVDVVQESQIKSEEEVTEVIEASPSKVLVCELSKSEEREILKDLFPYYF